MAVRLSRKTKSAASNLFKKLATGKDWDDDIPPTTITKKSSTNIKSSAEGATDDGIDGKKKRSRSLVNVDSPGASGQQQASEHVVNEPTNPSAAPAGKKKRGRPFKVNVENSSASGPVKKADILIKKKPRTNQFCTVDLPPRSQTIPDTPPLLKDESNLGKQTALMVENSPELAKQLLSTADTECKPPELSAVSYAPQCTEAVTNPPSLCLIDIATSDPQPSAPERRCRGRPKGARNIQPRKTKLKPSADKKPKPSKPSDVISHPVINEPPIAPLPSIPAVESSEPKVALFDNITPSLPAKRQSGRPKRYLPEIDQPQHTSKYSKAIKIKQEVKQEEPVKKPEVYILLEKPQVKQYEPIKPEVKDYESINPEGKQSEISGEQDDKDKVTGPNKYAADIAACQKAALERLSEITGQSESMPVFPTNPSVTTSVDAHLMSSQLKQCCVVITDAPVVIPANTLTNPQAYSSLHAQITTATTLTYSNQLGSMSLIKHLTDTSNTANQLSNNQSDLNSPELTRFNIDSGVTFALSLLGNQTQEIQGMKKDFFIPPVNQKTLPQLMSQKQMPAKLPYLKPKPSTVTSHNAQPQKITSLIPKKKKTVRPRFKMFDMPFVNNAVIPEVKAPEMKEEDLIHQSPASRQRSPLYYPCAKVDKDQFFKIFGLVDKSKLNASAAAKHRLHREAGGKLRRVIKPRMAPEMIYHQKMTIARGCTLQGMVVNREVERSPRNSHKSRLLLKALSPRGEQNRKVDELQKSSSFKENELPLSTQRKLDFNSTPKTSPKKEWLKPPSKRKLSISTCGQSEVQGSESSGMNDVKQEGYDFNPTRRSARQEATSRKQWSHLLKANPDIFEKDKMWDEEQERLMKRRKDRSKIKPDDVEIKQEVDDFTFTDKITGTTIETKNIMRKSQKKSGFSFPNTAKAYMAMYEDMMLEQKDVPLNAGRYDWVAYQASKQAESATSLNENYSRDDNQKAIFRKRNRKKKLPPGQAGQVMPNIPFFFPEQLKSQMCDRLEPSLFELKQNLEQVAVGRELELNMKNLVEEHDSVKLGSLAKCDEETPDCPPEERQERYKYKDEDCVVPHMCTVCWINDHMYCRNMKRIARDLPLFGGCLHYIPCTHYRHLKERKAYDAGFNKSGISQMKISNGRVAEEDIKLPTCGEDLICNESLKEFDSDLSSPSSPDETDTLRLQLRVRAAQLKQSLGITKLPLTPGTCSKRSALKDYITLYEEDEEKMVGVNEVEIDELGLDITLDTDGKTALTLSDISAVDAADPCSRGVSIDNDFISGPVQPNDKPALETSIKSVRVRVLGWSQPYERKANLDNDREKTIFIPTHLDAKDILNGPLLIDMISFEATKCMLGPDPKPQDLIFVFKSYPPGSDFDTKEKKKRKKKIKIKEVKPEISWTVETIRADDGESSDASGYSQEMVQYEQEQKDKTTPEIPNDIMTFTVNKNTAGGRCIRLSDSPRKAVQPQVVKSQLMFNLHSVPIDNVVSGDVACPPGPHNADTAVPDKNGDETPIWSFTTKDIRGQDPKLLRYIKKTGLARTIVDELREELGNLKAVHKEAQQPINMLVEELEQKKCLMAAVKSEKDVVLENLEKLEDQLRMGDGESNILRRKLQILDGNRKMFEGKRKAGMDMMLELERVQNMRRKPASVPSETVTMVTATDGSTLASTPAGSLSVLSTAITTTGQSFPAAALAPSPAITNPVTLVSQAAPCGPKNTAKQVLNFQLTAGSDSTIANITDANSTINQHLATVDVDKNKTYFTQGLENMPDYGVSSSLQTTSTTLYSKSLLSTREVPSAIQPSVPEEHKGINYNSVIHPGVHKHEGQDIGSQPEVMLSSSGNYIENPTLPSFTQINSLEVAGCSSETQPQVYDNLNPTLTQTVMASFSNTQAPASHLPATFSSVDTSEPTVLTLSAGTPSQGLSCPPRTLSSHIMSLPNTPANQGPIPIIPIAASHPGSVPSIQPTVLSNTGSVPSIQPTVLSNTGSVPSVQPTVISDPGPVASVLPIAVSHPRPVASVLPIAVSRPGRVLNIPVSSASSLGSMPTISPNPSSHPGQPPKPESHLGTAMPNIPLDATSHPGPMRSNIPPDATSHPGPMRPNIPPDATSHPGPMRPNIPPDATSHPGPMRSNIPPDATSHPGPMRPNIPPDATSHPGPMRPNIPLDATSHPGPMRLTKETFPGGLQLIKLKMKGTDTESYFVQSGEGTLIQVSEILMSAGRVSQLKLVPAKSEQNVFSMSELGTTITSIESDCDAAGSVSSAQGLPTVCMDMPPTSIPEIESTPQNINVASDTEAAPRQNTMKPVTLNLSEKTLNLSNKSSSAARYSMATPISKSLKPSTLGATTKGTSLPRLPNQSSRGTPMLNSLIKVTPSGASQSIRTVIKTTMSNIPPRITGENRSLLMPALGNKVPLSSSKIRNIPNNPVPLPIIRQSNPRNIPAPSMSNVLKPAEKVNSVFINKGNYRSLPVNKSMLGTILSTSASETKSLKYDVRPTVQSASFHSSLTSLPAQGHLPLQGHPPTTQHLPTSVSLSAAPLVGSPHTVYLSSLAEAEADTSLLQSSSIGTQMSAVSMTSLSPVMSNVPLQMSAVSMTSPSPVMSNVPLQMSAVSMTSPSPVMSNVPLQMSAVSMTSPSPIMSNVPLQTEHVVSSSYKQSPTLHTENIAERSDVSLLTFLRASSDKKKRQTVRKILAKRGYDISADETLASPEKNQKMSPSVSVMCNNIDTISHDVTAISDNTGTDCHAMSSAKTPVGPDVLECPQTVMDIADMQKLLGFQPSDNVIIQSIDGVDVQHLAAGAVAQQVMPQHVFSSNVAQSSAVFEVAQNNQMQKSDEHRVNAGQHMLVTPVEGQSSTPLQFNMSEKAVQSVNSLEVESDISSQLKLTNCDNEMVLPFDTSQVQSSIPVQFYNSDNAIVQSSYGVDMQSATPILQSSLPASLSHGDADGQLQSSDVLLPGDFSDMQSGAMTPSVGLVQIATGVNENYCEYTTGDSSQVVTPPNDLQNSTIPTVSLDVQKNSAMVSVDHINSFPASTNQVSVMPQLEPPGEVIQITQTDSHGSSEIWPQLVTGGDVTVELGGNAPGVGMTNFCDTYAQIDTTNFSDPSEMTSNEHFNLNQTIDFGGQAYGEHSDLTIVKSEGGRDLLSDVIQSTLLCDMDPAAEETQITNMSCE